MTNIKEAAQAFVPLQKLNIADLDKVSVEAIIEDEIVKEGTPEEFTHQVAIIKGKKYHTPGIVLSAVKLFLQNIPDMKYFKVIKEGEGVKTKYTVIPL